MSIIDYENEFSDAQAVTTTALSTNVIDLNSYPQYVAGEDLHAVCEVDTAFVGGTSKQVILWTDDTTTVTNGEAVHTEPAVVTASLTAGKSLCRVSLKGLELQQYLGFQYVVVGTYTAGKVNAFLETTPRVGEVTLS